MRKYAARPLGKPRAAVKVKRIGNSNRFEIIPGSVCLVSENTPVIERAEAAIVDGAGNTVTASGKFLWTAEAIDPYHLVVDMF